MRIQTAIDVLQERLDTLDGDKNCPFSVAGVEYSLKAARDTVAQLEELLDQTIGERADCAAALSRLKGGY